MRYFKFAMTDKSFYLMCVVQLYSHIEITYYINCLYNNNNNNNIEFNIPNRDRARYIDFTRLISCRLPA